jgi:AraC family transcriptional activator of tynA and feaB
MIVRICTDTVPQPERLDYWRQVRHNLFRDHCHIEPDRDAPFGASLSLMRIGPLTLSDCRGSAFRMVRQGCSESGGLALLIQKEGECVLRHQNREILLGPGRFCVLPADSPVEFEMRGTYRQLSLRFRASLMAERFPGWEQRAFSPVACDSGAGGMLLGLIWAMEQHGETSNTQCCLEAFQAMLGLLATALSEHTANAPHAAATRMSIYHKARIRSYVLENLANPELDIARIAGAVGLSQRYLHQLFADEPMQLMQWIWSERLERCFKALAHREERDCSVSAVAYSWGFNDASHFSRAFRKRYGVCPRDI